MNITDLRNQVIVYGAYRGIPGFCMGYAAAAWLGTSSPILTGLTLALHVVALDTFLQLGEYLRSQPGNSALSEHQEIGLFYVLVGTCTTMAFFRIDLIDIPLRNIFAISCIAVGLILVFGERIFGPRNRLQLVQVQVANGPAQQPPPQQQQQQQQPAVP